MSDRFELFLTCPKGLEGLLIEALGASEEEFETIGHGISRAFG